MRNVDEGPNYLDEVVNIQRRFLLPCQFFFFFFAFQAQGCSYTSNMVLYKFIGPKMIKKS